MKIPKKVTIIVDHTVNKKIDGLVLYSGKLEKKEISLDCLIKKIEGTTNIFAKNVYLHPNAKYVAEKIFYVSIPLARDLNVVLSVKIENYNKKIKTLLICLKKLKIKIPKEIIFMIIDFAMK